MTSRFLFSLPAFKASVFGEVMLIFSLFQLISSLMHFVTLLKEKLIFRIHKRIRMKVDAYIA